MFRLMALVALLLGFASGPIAAAPPVLPAASASSRIVSDANMGPAECRQLFHRNCNSWVGEWLHTLPIYKLPTTRDSLTTNTLDAFFYEGGTTCYLFDCGPGDGTWFTYGIAGPPKGHIVFDYAHHIVFIGNGCCAWSGAVLESNVSDPPYRVANRKLTGVRTARGAQLGMTVSDIEVLYGTPVLTARGRYQEGSAALAQHGAYSELKYTFRKTGNGLGPCFQDQLMLFYRGRLVGIDLSDSC